LTFARDLLEQAELLANKEPRRPKQASLRRAVSAAYYALFHLVIEDPANTLTPPAPVGLRRVVQRAFQHGQIKAACKDFVDGDSAKRRDQANSTRLPAALEAIIVFPLDPALVTVLTAFVDLQEARHKADYDLTEQWNRVEALSKISQARTAFAEWDNVRKTPNVAAFMSCLAFRKEWGRF
jgi:uncharacterized protein (UPF0332 family)